ncbi:MAG: hypothetical protein O6852_09900 [Gammaproteobacteria bacterium]|jgi:hypothetical protein|nr:hypothetical protein [Gammaproteobacteria bacterium]
MEDELLMARAKREANKMVAYFMQQQNGLWYLISAISQMPHFEDHYQEAIRKRLCKKASSLYHHSTLEVR